MRTAHTFAVLGVLLVSASSANATVVFDVEPTFAAGSAEEIDVRVTLTGGIGASISAFAFDWLLDSANVPLSAVEQPASSGTGPNLTCNNANNQFMCDFSAADVVGAQGSNSVGDGWLWNFTGPVADGTYYLGRFTFTSAAFETGGFVSIGQCEIVDSNVEEVPCSSNSWGYIPEPTTAALLGLGLAGLGSTRRRKA